MTVRDPRTDRTTGSSGTGTLLGTHAWCGSLYTDTSVGWPGVFSAGSSHRVPQRRSFSGRRYGSGSFLSPDDRAHNGRACGCCWVWQSTKIGEVAKVAVNDIFTIICLLQSPRRRIVTAACQAVTQYAVSRTFLAACPLPLERQMDR